MHDASLKLADGRTLAYTDCGDPDGPLVMYFHGAPTSRLDLVVFEGDSLQQGRAWCHLTVQGTAGPPL